MSDADRDRWNSRYLAGRELPLPPADSGLISLVESHPPGRALELACGVGQNAIALAARGWQVTAVDLSDVGLERARCAADQTGVEVDWIAADLDAWQPPAGVQYDLIVVLRFLDRVHLPALIVRSLQPGGLLLYEALLARPESPVQEPRSDAVDPAVSIRLPVSTSPPKSANPAFVVQPGELPTLFGDALELLSFQESHGATHSLARITARKRLDS